MEEEYLKKYYSGNMEDALEKLKEGIPVQYIVGSVNFFGLNFKVNNSVLIPRFETEELVDRTIKYIEKMFDSKINILDIGTGSGCIAITLNKKLNSNVDAIDISLEALEIAKENNLNNQTNVNFFNSNLYESITKKYDVIVSNPPYISEDESIMEVVAKNEPHIALYAKNNGLYFYEEILKEAINHLNTKYLIAFEIGQTQASEITSIANKYLNNIEIIVEKDLSNLDRYIFILSK